MATCSKMPSHCMLQAAKKCQKNTRACLMTPNSLGLSSLRKRNVSKSFGLKTSEGFRVSASAYKIKLITPEGIEHEFDCPDDQYVLDAAEEAGVDVPYSCRAGSCSTCAGKLESGAVDQSEGSFLDEGQLNQGYLLTCISYPTSDCTIYTHKEEDLY